MSPEFPYQIVSFLDQNPQVAEGVYQGANGWYPQIALKRRFKVIGLSEDDIPAVVSEFAQSRPQLKLNTGSLIKPERMPVQVIEVLNDEEIKDFHLDFIEFMGDRMMSRYPERDGENYLPHITAEYGEGFVINPEEFSNKSFTLNQICLIKDEKDTDSHVVQYFDLNG